jgi:hypothetical protein
MEESGGPLFFLIPSLITASEKPSAATAGDTEKRLSRVVEYPGKPFFVRMQATDQALVLNREVNCHAVGTVLGRHFVRKARQGEINLTEDAPRIEADLRQIICQHF